MEKGIKQEELDNLWDRISELAGGELWGRLNKREWKIAKRIFEIKASEILLLD